MSHNSSISGMGEPVPAIRVINEKRMLLITVGINIMLSCGKEYVKLAWEFICKPGRENLDFLQVKKSENDQAEHFLWFLDKYVSHAVDNHYFLQWSKSNRSKSFLDKVTASDIAYTILVYENTKEVWEEDLQIKASIKNDEERPNTTHHI